tara:strand:- start:113 stop:262 length:150 start_codon:yes stop_codon:yes gene_type:complete
MVYILEPIYPKSFLNGANPTEEEVDVAIKKMTNALEKNIKEKIKTIYEQ